MKRDIDRLMAERNLDAAVVMGNTLDSPTVYYLAGGVKLEGATILLRPGQRPVLIHSPMERDGAAETGMECHPFTRWNWAAMVKEMHGDVRAARIEQMRRILIDFGVGGRIGFYGHGEIGRAHSFLQGLAMAMPDSEIAVEFDRDLFSEARTTKDEIELRAMWDVARSTNAVVAAVAEMLTTRPVAGKALLAPGGEPLTIGYVKEFTRQECLKRGLEEPGEHIFSMGADAGVPHNGGNRDEVVELGKPIIFDIFPRSMGGGYYHDMTRTWCLGYAPPEVERAYDDAMAAFDQVMASLEVGRRTADYQAMTCELFEDHDHPTIHSDPQTQSGYVHSLAHGLGLEVHEAPSFYDYEGNQAVLQKGMVFTVEPGLYYPERGFGVRIEDVVYCDEAGVFHSMTPFSKELVLRMRG